MCHSQARQKLQEKVSDFHVQFHGPVYMSIGPEAKQDIYNKFDPGKPITVQLEPPLTGKSPLVELKQEGTA